MALFVHGSFSVLCLFTFRGLTFFLLHLSISLNYSCLTRMWEAMQHTLAMGKGKYKESGFVHSKSKSWRILIYRMQIRNRNPMVLRALLYLRYCTVALVNADAQTVKEFWYETSPGNWISYFIYLITTRYWSPWVMYFGNPKHINRHLVIPQDINLLLATLSSTCSEMTFLLKWRLKTALYEVSKTSGSSIDRPGENIKLWRP